jgi:hypothetical protein
LVPGWSVSGGDGVAVGFFPMAPAVEDQEDCGCFTAHAWRFSSGKIVLLRANQKIEKQTLSKKAIGVDSL